MRIKCPNSDILLELPGDRTDMKFTCPACHKIHRVTVSITTPGEDPPHAPSNTRSMTRQQPQMPKKYATGAYAPVVDVPIDANFVLVDASNPLQQGIDLGNAAPNPPPPFNPEMSRRQTEIINDRRPDSGRIVPPPPEAGPAESPAEDAGLAKDFSDAEATASDFPPRAARMSEDGPADSPATADAERGGGPREEPEPVGRPGGGLPARRREMPAKKPARVLPALLVLALAAVLGYLGWQQYLYENKHKVMEAYLLRADENWRKGEIAASASEAENARAALAEGKELNTALNLWNRLGAWSGMFSPRPDSTGPMERRIDAHLERNRRLDAFRSGLDPAGAAEMASSLRDAAPDVRGDEPLFGAMQQTVIAAALGELESFSENNTPEEAAAKAAADRLVLMPVLAEPHRSGLDNELARFEQEQRERLIAQAREELSALALAAAAGNPSTLERFLHLSGRLEKSGIPELAKPPADINPDADPRAIRQLSRLAALVDRATRSARTILSRSEDENTEIDDLVGQAEADVRPHAAMAEAATGLIDDARSQGDDLLRLRAEVYGRIQQEMRRNRDNPGPRLAWSMLRMGFDDPDIAINPAGFSFDSNRARMEFSFRGLSAVMDMGGDDHENMVRATLDGYHFSAGWALLFRKPLSWMADTALAMRKAGVSPAVHPNWELFEGPGGPLAVSVPAIASGTAMASAPGAGAARQVFFNNRLLPVTELPLAGDSRRVVEDFRRAAEKLHNGIMADESIPQRLRQALMPVLAGARQQPDARDYFDSAFCRRLIEANYLETYIIPMPEDRRRELDAFRKALDKLEAGYDDFAVTLENGERLVAVSRMDADSAGPGMASDQDPDSGETIPRHTWRIEKEDSTVFFSPLPARFVYAFSLAEHYDGRHRIRPAARPRLTEVWHATRGLIGSYESGAGKATGDAALWDEAIGEDSSGRYDPTIGRPGWNFPFHVLERDGQGDPLTLATLSGVVESPDFSGINEEAERRRAEDAWLDSTAATLSTPGELGLIFHQFFRYCSDSPLPELPNLIGSHYGLSDTHQTVYESLERRWVGRLIGDCDDLAEFFQVLTRKQGKLSHVMQLPGHAAAGYVEKTADGNHRFIVLQTGPVLQFNAPTMNEAVELAYRSFDRGEGLSHMTTDAVPLLLRFADEETRTPFVLSARIYGDAEYAETMIQVQSYWHKHVYSAAVKVMEEMVREDKEIGNIKELGSLYERVGMYDKSAEMRYAELEMVKDNPQAAISTLLEIVQLHFQDKDREKALAALALMEERMLAMIRNNDPQEFFRAMSFRSFWAMFLSRLGQPARAWELVKYDVSMTKQQLGRVADPVLHTLVTLYDRMAMQRDASAGGSLPPDGEKAMREVRRELEDAFGRGYFKADDSYNAIIGRYFVLGRYAVSDIGRTPGMERLRADGPYPTAPRDVSRRGRGLGDDDWDWFRITPQLYLAIGSEMLDRDEYPELFDPAGAKLILEDVRRAVDKGTGLGSDVAGGDDAVKAEMTLAFLNRDLRAFRKSMLTVKEKDYASLYDDAAMTFGLHCGFVPLSEFAPWTEAFREYFPGSQHYFKVVYRAIDKENYDHALMMAEATARFFPDDELLRKEAEFIRGIIPGLKERKLGRELRGGAGTGADSARPAA